VAGKESANIKPVVIERGESYVFRAEYFDGSGCKITLFDPRDLDLLDKDRIHAVILNQAEMSILVRRLNEMLFVQGKFGDGHKSHRQKGAN